jgi:hypothetical protein
MVVCRSFIDCYLHKMCDALFYMVDLFFAGSIIYVAYVLYAISALLYSFFMSCFTVFN